VYTEPAIPIQKPLAAISATIHALLNNNAVFAVFLQTGIKNLLIGASSL
jgi:hypothetical protein